MSWMTEHWSDGSWSVKMFYSIVPRPVTLSQCLTSARIALLR
ncbi:MAG: hypothetical protein ABJF89_04245 [Parasphingorhabdus sp.]